MLPVPVVDDTVWHDFRGRSVGGTFGEEHRARFVSGKGSQMPAAPPPRGPIKPQTQWEKLQERFLDAWYKHVLRKERPKKTYRWGAG